MRSLGLSLLAIGLASCAAPPTSGPAAAGPGGQMGRSAAPSGVARVAAPRGEPRDAFVLLSGGGTPMTNNYSQYLQAKAMTAFFARGFPADATWIFFGIGNREGESPRLADARRQLKKGNLLLESWVPGVLPGNRPATRESFLGALRNEILPRVRDGGTLYLFVGDHGERSTTEPRESVITLWEFKQRTAAEGGWAPDPKEQVGVTELRKILAEGLGEGRVVFCMSQCYSGGFHFLGVPNRVQAPATWLDPRARDVPAPVRGAIRAAGFTATDGDSMAAGCVPDPDPDRWAGYERYVPENLTGLDMFTLAPTARLAASFADAHEAAVLVDETIDKPRASSEQYLERWAIEIERMAKLPRLPKTTAAAVTRYAATVDTGTVVSMDPDLAKQAQQFGRFVSRMTEQHEPSRVLLTRGTRKQLEAAIATSPAHTHRAPSGEAKKAWTETLRPAWQRAVLAGEVTFLSGHALAFEKHLLTREDRGRDFMLASSYRRALMFEMYWQSSYAFPARLDQAKADAVTRWGAERRGRILQWARKSPDGAVRAAADLIAPPRPVSAGPAPAPVTPPGRALTPKTAAERTLFYRRVLAAWQFLLEMKHDAALDELRSLRELERTPFPRASESQT